MLQQCLVWLYHCEAPEHLANAVNDSMNAELTAEGATVTGGTFSGDELFMCPVPDTS